jgi:hypothetical protein
MLTRLPLERLNNDFAKQFMAMRYLLLGLMENRAEYAPALMALESAAPYVTTFSHNPKAVQAYRRNMLEAFDLYPKLGDHLDRAGQMTRLLSPDFMAYPAEYPTPELDSDDVIENPEPVVLSAPVAGQFDKLYVSMQYFLLGMIVYDRTYQVAYDALMFAETYHVGFRKDGVTPEFQHQLEIGHLIRTMLRGLMYPAETLASVFLHDTPEDYGVKRAIIEEKFGPRVAHATALLNKYDDEGNAKPLDTYYSDMAYDPIASVAKPADNAHNQSTMGTVFAFKKQFDYSLNIKTRSWEMMKVARRNWPQQESVYENLKFLLRVQYNAVQAMLHAVQFDPATGKVHPALQK